MGACVLITGIWYYATPDGAGAGVLGLACGNGVRRSPTDCLRLDFRLDLVGDAEALEQG